MKLNRVIWVYSTDNIGFFLATLLGLLSNFLVFNLGLVLRSRDFGGFALKPYPLSIIHQAILKSVSH
ncbi:hypothetical protein H5410_056186 [Solanum commersonii]|uniref:Uncharacterized protein n=1 Tax=Solanum commersonii TaxID=4109 RepID=A0A9J5WLI9_SOLCO|nr:hypothetical protein H5410_056186 [Solanum commersonii]